MKVSLVLDASAVAKWFIEKEEFREMREVKAGIPIVTGLLFLENFCPKCFNTNC